MESGDVFLSIYQTSDANLYVFLNRVLVNFLPNLPVLTQQEEPLSVWLLCALPERWIGEWRTGEQARWGPTGEGRLWKHKIYEAIQCDCTKSFISRIREHISTHGSKTNCIFKKFSLRTSTTFSDKSSKIKSVRLKKTNHAKTAHGEFGSKVWLQLGWKHNENNETVTFKCYLVDKVDFKRLKKRKKILYLYVKCFETRLQILTGPTYRYGTV